MLPHWPVPHRFMLLSTWSQVVTLRRLCNLQEARPSWQGFSLRDQSLRLCGLALLLVLCLYSAFSCRALCHHQGQFSVLSFCFNFWATFCFIYMGTLPACMSASCMYLIPLGSRRRKVFDPVSGVAEVMCCHLGAGNWTPVFCKSSKCLNYQTIFKPLLIILN